jgi:AcrR family transcriptional regulator
MGLHRPLAPTSRGATQPPSLQVLEVQRLWILSAVAKIACEQGLGSVTVAQIMSRAGVSRSKFYELFENREDCFLQTFEEAVALLAKRVLPAYESQDSWTARMRAGMGALLQVFDEAPELAGVCVVHALEAGPQTLARRGEVLERLAEAVDEGRRAPRAGTQLEPVVAEGVVGGVLAVIHARLLQADGRALIDLSKPLMFMIVLPYLGMSAALKELSRPAPRAHRAPERKGARDKPAHHASARARLSLGGAMPSQTGISRATQGAIRCHFL